jgi:hypothetical protein
VNIFGHAGLLLWPKEGNVAYSAIKRRWLAIRFVLTILLCAVAGQVGAADVLTQHYNNARTGANLDETALDSKTLRAGTFGKLWTLTADGQVVAQPLYVSRLAIDTAGNPDTPPVRGTFNAVIIATLHNTIYVYDADNEKRGPDGRTIPLWAKWLGQPRRGGGGIDMFYTNDPEWGILSTPVISDDRKTLYVVAWHDDGADGIRYKLHALDLASGADRQAPVIIGVSSTAAPQPCNLQSLFNPCTQKQRAALLLSNGILYIGLGGDGNRGALFAFDAASLTQKALWSTTPNGVNGGIWQSGQGPAADADGNIYLMTGNGTFDAGTGGGENYGDSFVKLRLEGPKLVVKDFFTPCNQKFLQDHDLDLGSAGPALIADTPPWIIGGGKEGVLYVLSRTNMGKHVENSTAGECENTNAVHQVTAFPQTMDGHYGNIHGSPVFWKGPDAARIYAWGENSPLKAYRFKDGKLLDVDAPKQSAFQPPPGMPGGMLSLTANGSAAGSGILWAAVPLDGDANKQRGVHGIVLALDAEDVSQTLWTSERVPGRDRLGLFAKFTPPTVAGGKLFIATYGDNEPLHGYFGADVPTQFPANYYVAVYGMMAAPTAPRQVVNQDRDDVTVVRAATEPLTLDTRTCKTVDAGSLDCTDALALKFDRPGLYRTILPAHQDVAACALLRVTVAAKTDGLRTATGVGFWSSQAVGGNQAADDSGRFVAKDQLASVGTGTLKDGSPATLLEFVAVANCASSDGAGVARLFKPYMQFEAAPDGRIQRNWDLASNYRIGRDVPSFDRAGDVLR